MLLANKRSRAVRLHVRCVSDAPGELAQSHTAAETFSKPLAEAANLSIADSPLAESIIEEIRLHL